MNKDYTNEVNLLTDKLATYDDFSCSYGRIRTVILDESKDIARIVLGLDTVVDYVYSGFRHTPIFVNPELLQECLEIVEDIEVDL